jgi:hypothetical protein
MEEKVYDIEELIKVESLPKIFYQLEVIGQEVDKALSGIEDMVCNEENKKEVKKRKQEITAFKNLMETRRKEIKKQVMAKYDEFNEKYEAEVKSKLTNAENILTVKYTAIEIQQKLEKEKELREFAERHFESYNFQDLVTFENIGLNITLTASVKSLKEQVIEFCNKIQGDLNLIELEEFKEEILLEYKETLNFANAKIKVANRHKQLEEIKKKQEELEQIKQEEQMTIDTVIEMVEDEIKVEAPKPIYEDEEKLEVSFTVRGTKQQLKELKEFLINGGYDYD